MMPVLLHMPTSGRIRPMKKKDGSGEYYILSSTLSCKLTRMFTPLPSRPIGAPQLGTIGAGPSQHETAAAKETVQTASGSKKGKKPM